ncbi:MAG: acyltransferase family protein [Lachnospiraceae bacterium]|nr:acyltransferase family protein [Lachnospiraceae bacterium]
MEQTKERDLLFDNMKGFLIFFVIVGHMLNERLGEAMWLKDIYYVIKMFHMPAFIFVLGYFSKNTKKSAQDAVRKFLIPYIIFDVIMGVIDYIVYLQANEPMVFFDYFRITKPRYGLWFLLTAFIYKILAGDIKKFRFNVPFALLIGLCLPFFPDFGLKLSLGRTFGYLFFFALGLWFKPEYIEKLRKIPAWIGWIAIVLTTIYSVYACENKIIKKEVLHFRYPYDDKKKIKQMMMRLIIYLVASIIIVSFMIITTRKKCFLSKIGMNSVSVYVFHLFAVKWVARGPFLEGKTAYFFAFSLAYSALLTWLFSRDLFMKLYGSITGLVYKIVYKSEPVTAGVNEAVWVDREADAISEDT